jgi:hypothetical protein
MKETKQKQTLFFSRFKDITAGFSVSPINKLYHALPTLQGGFRYVPVLSPRIKETAFTEITCTSVHKINVFKKRTELRFRNYFVFSFPSFLLFL